LSNKYIETLQKLAIMKVLRILLLLFWSPHSLVVSGFICSSQFAFRKSAVSSFRSYASNEVIKTDSFITTSSENLDKNLTSDEKSVVNIVRIRSPSVVSVTSYTVPIDERATKRGRSRTKAYKNTKEQVPPIGSTALGSGSAFSITDDGYLLTNYHVIERAYQMQQTSIKIDQFYHNVTQRVQNFPLLVPFTQSYFQPKPTRMAQVYVQLFSSLTNIPCRIVSVKPENDIAILHLNATSMESASLVMPSPIPDGLSTDLLVGQNVLAIGNPFGLSQTVTTGVVSSLDRTVKGIAGNDIKGCIQTDAAINPGNSGGPLMNSMGQVIGVNTMIISTSGSNAGIGFAVPVDGFWREVMDLIEDDRVEEKMMSGEGNIQRRKRGWLGLKVVQDESIGKALFRRIGLNGAKHDDSKTGVFVMCVDDESPASDAGIVPLNMHDETLVQIGDRIVALNGNSIQNCFDMKKEIKDRTVGEQITMTLEDASGERRVVYITLKAKP
jgi:S1-C subfamily serine protease